MCRAFYCVSSNNLLTARAKANCSVIPLCWDLAALRAVFVSSKAPTSPCARRSLRSFVPAMQMHLRCTLTKCVTVENSRQQSKQAAPPLS